MKAFAVFILLFCIILFNISHQILDTVINFYTILLNNLFHLYKKRGTKFLFNMANQISFVLKCS
jgi:hypothetical protein